MDGFVDEINMDLDSKRSLNILVIWWYSTHLDDNRVVVVKSVYMRICGLYIYTYGICFVDTYWTGFYVYININTYIIHEHSPYRRFGDQKRSFTSRRRKQPKTWYMVVDGFPLGDT